ncbi:MAG TPA: hypothetical protein VKJ07_14255, partial [Mycobacteriales bacterium]|nr:hypothetical protein [Mycobacteriales bacterium]
MQDVEQVVAQRGRLEDAAVEQDRVDFCVTSLGRVSRQELGEVTRDRRVADVGQPHFVQPCPRPAHRHRVARRFRKESLEHDPAHVVGRHRCVQRTADDTAATTHHRHCVAGRRVRS